MKDLLAIGKWAVLVVFMYSIATSGTQADEPCGGYDHRAALDLKQKYQEALKARDYQRLKQLKQQRENIDLWAKNSGECSSSDGSSDDSAGGDTAQSSPTINSSEIDFDCPFWNLSCMGKQKICKDWVSENTEETGLNWLDELPACACNSSVLAAIEPSWAFARGDAPETQEFHPGADGGCYRSPAVETSAQELSAQQCCYDSTNQLITGGAAAGTPDLDAADGVSVQIPDIPWIDIIESDSVIITEQAEGGHFTADVLPFIACGWEIYNQVRQPNNANSCAENIR